MPTLRRKKWLLLVGKILLLAALAWFVRGSLESGLAELQKHQWQPQPAWLALGGVFYLLAMLPSALFMQRLLVATRQPTSTWATLRAFYVSQIGKYTPGKALVVVLRTALLRGPGVENTVVAATVFAETLTSMAVGAFWAAVLLAAMPRPAPLWIVAAVGMFLATGLPTLPQVMQVLLERLGIGRINPTAAEKLGSVSYGNLATGWLTISVGWLVYGLSLWATLRGVGCQEAGAAAALPLHVAATALAVVGGFLTLIPGGILTRELIFLQLLQPVYPQHALVASGMLRLVWLVAEVAMALVLYPCGRRWGAALPEQVPAAEPPTAVP